MMLHSLKRVGGNNPETVKPEGYQELFLEAISDDYSYRVSINILKLTEVSIKIQISKIPFLTKY